jgi:hypothetical protein
MKHPNWKQRTAIDQFVCIRGSLAGAFDNFQEGIVSQMRFEEQAAELLDQLEMLEPYLKHPEKW